MFSKRLLSRIASAKPIGRSYLKGKKMLFNKRSTDGSGKANLMDSYGDVTWGVLYAIDIQDLDRLDRVEGGYDRVSAQVWKPEGDVVEALSYISTNLTDAPVAYESYKKIVVTGAREHNLPQDYIAYLEQLPSKPDGTKPETVD